MDMTIESLFFEQVSAFATVGLSLGITPELSTPSKLWIILSMFVGRVVRAVDRIDGGEVPQGRAHG